MIKKLWFHIFIRVAIIFICTLLVIILANSTLLYRYYLSEQKRTLTEQAMTLSKADFSDSRSISETLAGISEDHNIDVEIYSDDDTILYTTQGDKLMEFIHQDRNGIFSMSRRPLEPTGESETRNGFILQTARDRMSGEEYLICSAAINDSTNAELKVRVQIIENSSHIAGRFITGITALCFFVAIIWIFLFARKFSRPITEMTEITGSLAALNFDRRVPAAENNEIGELGESINNMAASLKLTMEELKAANIRLQGEVEAERNLDKMRKQFVANVSHELKTPISIISGYAEGLKLNVNSEKRKEYCDIILDESARMNSLVLSILELSRYESGQVPLNKETFKLKDITDNLLNRIFAGSSLNIVNEINEEHIIYADILQFEQAIKSYLENAKSHTVIGGTVTLKTEDTGDNIRISVINDGEHIEEEKMPLIWQSFYRGEQSHKRDGGRFGLGLSIVGAIATLHETSCGVYNTENGVCFWIEFKKSQDK